MSAEDSDAADENEPERIDIVIIKEEDGVEISKENIECTVETER